MNKEKQKKERIGWIDIAKAMGIFIVLVNHAMLDLGIVTYLGGMFYMPVFFVLSGYTYKEKAEESFADFVKSKAKRLLIPYAFFQLFLTGIYTLKNIIEGQDFIKAIIPVLGAIYSRNAIYPNQEDVLLEISKTNLNLMSSLNAPLWFLTGLFCCLVIYKMILSKAGGNQKKELIYLTISLLIGIVLKYFCPILLPWSLDSAFIHVIFLHMGRILKRRAGVHFLWKKPMGIFFVLALFLITAYWNGSANLSIRDFGKSVILYVLVGGSGSVSMIFLSKWLEEKLRHIAVLFEMVGRHTIGILALHLVCFTGIGLILSLLGITIDEIQKVAKVLVSVVILVPIDGMIQTYLPFIYGQKRRKQ